MADPVSAYHYVNNKVHNPENADQEYTGPEMARDLALMLLAANSLIQHNVKLSHQVLKAEKDAEEAAVIILQKDMDNYELSQKLAHLKKEGPNA